ncbi:hypothetical protein [Kordia sp.]|uniref:hypothetical protein n=1 Tax=Kordia sp. TaxID=1965332 RepID=UPI003D2C4764
METFEMTTNSSVNLSVGISSDANVGSNVNLNDKLIKKSRQYSFKSDIGNSNDIHNGMLSVVSNFFVNDNNIDIIMNNTTVKYLLKDSMNTKNYECKKVKINNNLFMAYIVIKLLGN